MRRCVPQEVEEEEGNPALPQEKRNEYILGRTSREYDGTAAALLPPPPPPLPTLSCPRRSFSGDHDPACCPIFPRMPHCFPSPSSSTCGACGPSSRSTTTALSAPAALLAAAALASDLLRRSRVLSLRAPRPPPPASAAAPAAAPEAAWAPPLGPWAGALPSTAWTAPPAMPLPLLPMPPMAMPQPFTASGGAGALLAVAGAAGGIVHCLAKGGSTRIVRPSDGLRRLACTL